MAQPRNPFAKQQKNPFVDPAAASSGQTQSLVEDVDGDDVPAIRQDGSGAWNTNLWGQTSNVAYNQAQQQTLQNDGGWNSPTKSQQRNTQPPNQAKGPPSGWGSWGEKQKYQKFDVETEASKAISQREKDLQKREKDYQKRQQELKNLEVDMQKSGISVKRRNFPPLIRMCYHNISEEIPEHLKGLCRRVFFVWMGFILCNIFNFVAVCVGFGGFGAMGQVFAFCLALGYMVIAVPSSWFSWYQRLYNAMKSNGVVGYILFFISGGLAILFCVYQAIGPPIPGFIPGGNQASAGVVQAIKLFMTSGPGAKVAGIFYIVAAVLWILETLVFFVVYIQVFRQFNNSGGTQRVQTGAQAVGSLASRMDQV